MAERLKLAGVKHTFLTLPEEDYLFDRQIDKENIGRTLPRYLISCIAI
ncbi:hypothetical protein P7H09_06885 [Paenibacillus larvae]|uniref:Uncharacterized protein n=1 Tax=Paenibacillus larvae TaxID=1464 RepID=A0AAP5JSI8_9BACL|nr:hypothetical protein [Paenibacillus larvae]